MGLQNIDIDDNSSLPPFHVVETKQWDETLETLKCAACWEIISTESTDIETWGINCTSCGAFSDDGNRYHAISSSWKEAIGEILTQNIQTEISVENIQASGQSVTISLNLQGEVTDVVIPYTVQSREWYLPDEDNIITDIDIQYSQISWNNTSLDQKFLISQLVKYENDTHKITDAIRIYFYDYG